MLSSNMYWLMIANLKLYLVSHTVNNTLQGLKFPFFVKVIAIASAALDGFRNEAKKMVVALVDMERAFVPPQHFIRLVQRRYAWLGDGQCH